MIGTWRTQRLALLAVMLLAACAGSSPHMLHGEPGRLRVMSYNIHAGTGGLARIADVIRRERADVVGLQEVDVHFSPRSDFVDQASALAGMLDMHVRFAHIYELAPDRPAAPPREYGVAVLSRHPVTSFRNHVIPRLSTVVEEPEPKPRPGFLEATIDLAGRPVRVFNTHLDYRGDPRVRRMQVAAMTRIIGSNDVPTVLTGDLNAEPHAPELQPLLERMHDSWSASRGAGLTFPADSPVKRIDFVLHSAHFGVDSVHVPTTLASDHLPVVVDLLLLHP